MVSIVMLYSLILLSLKTANLIIPDPEVEGNCFEVMGLRFGLTVAKAVRAVVESTREIISHVMYFLFSLPAQKHPNFNAS